jgi:glycosyltransferase involved in cell wall biosynthesis
MNICTIVAKNYVAHARVLAESFREHHPEGTCFVLLIDEPGGYIDAEAEPFELVRPAELGIEDYERMAAIYDVVELSTAVKPWLLGHLLDGVGMDRVVYFDPDIRIFGRLDRLEELVREHGLVLIPHVTSPLPRDGKKPSEADILIAGTYNLGFIGLERGPRTSRLLEWWSERLKTDCVVAPELGYFVDQRWMDFAHGVMPGFHVLRDPAYNVAYWNLHGRDLALEGGRYHADGRPLRFFHFSGFDPEDRKRLSKHQSRIELRGGSALARICEEYADALLAHGYKRAKNWPYTYGALPNGVRLDRHMHRLYREGAESGALGRSMFDPEGAREFVAWLNEPAQVGGQYGVTRYLYKLYTMRSDLQKAFPNLDGPDAARLLRWARLPGFAAEPVPERLLPPAPERPGALESSGKATQGTPGPPTGVNVVGYLRSELGVGEAARQMIAALETQGIPTTTVGVTAEHSRQGHEYETAKTEPSFPVNLVCVNADALPAFAVRAGFRFFAGRYSVGLWWWEVSEFPERWTGSFDYLDEVWVGSHHVAEAIASVSPVPVVKVTMPVSMPQIKEFDRRALGLPEGFVFLFVFDYHSVFERKNPLAAVEAFKRAFAPGSGASLAIKSINGDQHPKEHARLVAAAGDHPDVHVIDRYVSVDEKNAMIASCDCYVSLHRSEGFGFTLAEAMYLGKPVIATAYSGNMDFMTDRNSYPVDYELRPIGGGADPYPATGEWADPDVEHAAGLMRRVFDHREEARQRGERAAADIRRRHSPQAAGRVLAKRLEHIEARASRDPATGQTAVIGLSTIKSSIVKRVVAVGLKLPPRLRRSPLGRFVRRRLLGV